MTDILKPNVKQQFAADKFFEFLLDPTAKEFTISGSAGVGKTFLMGYIIDKIMPRYSEMCKLLGIKEEYTTVMMTATTNKAADVLSQSTKRPTQTIHSFLNLKVTENFTTGKKNLEKTRNWCVHENMIIFTDECSMIDNDLDRVFQEGTHNCKIVYVGDKDQLAPVGLDTSPIYKRNIPIYELTEQMRNSGQPALMDVCQQLRETVQTGVFKPIQIVPGVIDHLNTDEMRTEVTNHFSQQTMDSRILCYTNRTVMEYNNGIRKLRQLPDEYQEGELLVNNSSIRIKSRMISVEEDVEIIKLGPIEKHQIPSRKTPEPVMLDVQLVDIHTALNGTFHGVPIPTDRAHYDELKRYFQKNKMWEERGYMTNTFPDLRPRDAATVHKSQGSTYQDVFIDLDDISTCNFKDQAARMLYVAFSRAKNRVFLYGNLADKYGGLIEA